MITYGHEISRLMDKLIREREIDKRTKIKALKESTKKKHRRNTGIVVKCEGKKNTNYYTVTKISALPWNLLPSKYLQTQIAMDKPAVYKHENALYTKEGFFLLREGKIISKEALLLIMDYIRMAGLHLAQINMDLSWKARKKNKIRVHKTDHTLTTQDGELRSRHAKTKCKRNRRIIA